jgi:pimeloyl-ACP methyl ester carboxylesterase
VTAAELEVPVGDRVLLVRDAGDPDGQPLVYFHGTPGSRLDLSFGEAAAERAGVRIVSFDRPGYGGSTAAPFGLAAVARDTGVVADHLGLSRFATLGQSGGGPFALGAAAVLGNRVTRVGVTSGAAPFQLVPGALDRLDENDQAAHAHLPGDPEAAARGFSAGFEPLRDLLQATDEEAAAGFEPFLSTSDVAVMSDPAVRAASIGSMREGLRNGTEGGGWDNVAWIGAWDIDLDEVRCPVFLWFGDEDRMASMAGGEWLNDNLHDAHLVRRAGEGHLGFVTHFDDVLDALVSVG